eukprot:jgi/Chlat1/5778/Chrsp387S05498
MGLRRRRGGAWSQLSTRSSGDEFDEGICLSPPISSASPLSSSSLPSDAQRDSPASSTSSCSPGQYQQQETLAAAFIDEPLNPPVVYGNGPDMYEIWYQLYYDVDQCPVTQLRHLTVRFENKLDAWRSTRAAAAAILQDDSNYSTQVLQHIWELGQGVTHPDDGLPVFTTCFTKGHFKYNYSWCSKLSFPVSTPASPLEVFVEHPRGWQPRMPWPPRETPKRATAWWLRTLDAVTLVHWADKQELPAKQRLELPWFAYAASCSPKGCIIDDVKLREHHPDMCS